MGEATAQRRTLTVAEAAEELGISRSLAYQMARQEVLPSLRLGRRLLVPRDAFERWLAAQGAQHHGDPA